jgi:putative ABC transport system permease protein
MRVMLILRLALGDWLDEWPSSMCLAIGVAAASAPLLLLLAIRTGVVAQLRAELDRFPSSRELVSTGQPVVEWKLVREIAAREDVAFVSPQTRLLAANAVVSAGDANVAVDIVPSGPGDPLAPGLRPGGIVLSDGAARGLMGRGLTGSGLTVRPGYRVVFKVNRIGLDGRQAVAMLPLRLDGIIDPRAAGRRIALVDTGLVVATEIYRERPDVADLATALALARADMPNRRYSGLRLYARSVDDVAALRTRLLRAGIDTESRIEEIRLVKRLDTGLSTIILVIAVVSGLGLSLSLAAAQWGWVERRRADLSYLRLIGFAPADIALLPVVLGQMVVLVGLGLAVLLGFAGQQVVNRLFAGQLASLSEISRISGSDIAIVAGLSVIVALLASVAASLAVARISPAAALRGQ